MVSRQLNRDGAAVSSLILKARALLESRWAIVLIPLVLSQLSGCGRQTADRPETAVASLSVDEVISYLDPVAGFSGKIPVGWRRITLSEPDEESYAISFESPPSDDDDVFADYLMVEFLAASEAEGFVADPEERLLVTIDGREAYRDKLLLDRFDVGQGQLDLVVYQLTLLEIGYSFGLYVVGEQHEAPRLSRVFDEFVDSFRFPSNPVQVSLCTDDRVENCLETLLDTG